MNKITIIGSGRVGESTAQFIAAKNLCREIVLLDINEGAAKGAALDIQEVAPLFGYDTRLIGSTDHAMMADSEIIIITAGLPRKPGMSRSITKAVMPRAAAVASVFAYTTSVLASGPLVIHILLPLST